MPENTETENESQRPLTASVEKLRQELDHWLEVALSQGEKALDKIGIRNLGKSWCPPADVVETDDDVRVFVDLPGVDPQSVEVTLAGNMLTLQGEKSAFQTDENDQMHTHERSAGKFSRSIPMPAPVDADAVHADTVNGVLHVRLPKTERARPRQIPIGVPSVSAASSQSGTSAE